MTPNPPVTHEIGLANTGRTVGNPTDSTRTDQPPTPALRVSLPTLPAKRGQIRLTKIFPPGTGENTPKGKPAFSEDNECD